MSNYVENLNDLIVAKKEIKSIIKDAGVEPGDVFSYYPAYIRAAIAGGGTIFDPDDYYTTDYIDENFVSYSYLAAALEDIDVDVDLDDYVTYSYAYNTFVSYAYLGDLEQISEYILGSGSSSAPENVYATKTELGAYVSKDLLSTLGYVTSTDLPIINENLIPKENATYTLGDNNTFYAATYTARIGGPSGGISFRVGSSNRATFGNVDFRPQTDLGVNLGRETNRWGSTYTANLYTNTAYLQDTSYTKSIVPAGSDTYFLGDTSNYYHSTYTNRIRGNSAINFVTGGNNRVTVTGTAMRPMLQNYNLGSSDYPFATAYISNIYNFIWTGTSAEYAALDNYTSYQIYLIQEA